MLDQPNPLTKNPALAHFLFTLACISLITALTAVITITTRAPLSHAQDASGLPTITGTAQVGQSLTSDASAITDADGIPDDVVYGYQWIRVAQDSETPIHDATDSTYTPTAADVGHRLKVKYIFGDNANNYETRTSVAFPVDNYVTDACDSTDSNEHWCAVLTVGSETSASNTGWIDATTDTGELDPKTFQYSSASRSLTQFIINPSGILIFTFEPAVLLGTSQRLQFGHRLLDFADAGTSNNVYSWTNPGITWADGDTVPVKILTVRPNRPVAGSISIGGAPRVSQTLHTDLSGLVDLDGLPQTFDYRWQEKRNNAYTDIIGANDSTYQLTSTRAGRKVRIQVSFTDLAGNAETSTSADYPSSGNVTNTSHFVRVTNIGISDPGTDNLYTDGETVDYTVTLSNPTTVLPTSSLFGTQSEDNTAGFKCASPHGDDAIAPYHSGSGTDTIIFRCGVADEATTQSVAAADSVHIVGHGNDRYYRGHPAYQRQTSLHGVAGPTITSAALQPPLAGHYWAHREPIKNTFTFSENIVIDASRHAPSIVAQEYSIGALIHQNEYTYQGEHTANSITLQHINGDTRPRHAVAFFPNTLHSNRAVITSAATGAPADLSHTGHQNAAALLPPCGGTNPAEIWCSSITPATSGSATGFDNSVHGSLPLPLFNQDGIVYATTRIRHAPSTGLVWRSPTPTHSATPTHWSSASDQANTTSRTPPAAPTATPGPTPPPRSGRPITPPSSGWSTPTPPGIRSPPNPGPRLHQPPPRRRHRRHNRLQRLEHTHDHLPMAEGPHRHPGSHRFQLPAHRCRSQSPHPRDHPVHDRRRSNRLPIQQANLIHRRSRNQADRHRPKRRPRGTAKRRPQPRPEFPDPARRGHRLAR